MDHFEFISHRLDGPHPCRVVDLEHEDEPHSGAVAQALGERASEGHAQLRLATAPGALEHHQAVSALGDQAIQKKRGRFAGSVVLDFEEHEPIVNRVPVPEVHLRDAPAREPRPVGSEVREAEPRLVGRGEDEAGLLDHGPQPAIGRSASSSPIARIFFDDLVRGHALGEVVKAAGHAAARVREGTEAYLRPVLPRDELELLQDEVAVRCEEDLDARERHVVEHAHEGAGRGRVEVGLGLVDEQHGVAPELTVLDEPREQAESS